MEIKVDIDEKKFAEKIIDKWKRHNFVGKEQRVTIVYNVESEVLLYTVKEA
ncbi:hypothetical protein SANA_24730 [Gottschalkiaceae bacterium SANA]|nr:hypothetical protein SANA_24730 [Gottschalkiaceae bacterium SANA]